MTSTRIHRLAPNAARLAFVLDEKQRVVRWSLHGKSMLGFESSEALDRPCYELFLCRDWEGRSVGCPSCSIFRAAMDGRLGQAPLLLRRKDGRWAPFLTTLGPEPAQPGASVVLQALASLDLPALETVTATVARSTNLGETMDGILDQALVMTGAEAAEVFLAEGDYAELSMASHRGLFAGAFSEKTSFHIGEGFPGLVAAGTGPLTTTSLGTDARYLRTRVKEKGVQYYLCLPLLSESGVIGCLNVASRSIPRDNQALLSLLWPMAHMASAAVQVSRLKALDAVSAWDVARPAILPHGIDPLRGLDPLLQHILRSMIVVEGADGGAVSLWDPGSRSLRTRVAEGMFQEQLCHPQACPALEKGSPLISDRREPRSGACREEVRGVAQTVCLPLLRGEMRMGVIVLGSRQTPSLPSRHLGLLSTMATRAAQAIGQAREYVDEEGRRAGAARQEAGTRNEEAGTREQGPGVEVPALEVRCFGVFQVVRNGSILPRSAFSRRKALTALKVLVTRRGRPVSRDFLIECLWPEADPEAAEGGLQVVIHSLRRSVEPDRAERHILTEGDSYCFDAGPSCRVDVDEFLRGIEDGKRLQARGEIAHAIKRYQDAAYLYVGDFLEDEPYSDWCSVEREALKETYFSLLKTIAGLLGDGGDVEGGIHYLRKALAVDQVREQTHRELMHALWQAGRRDEALRQYVACRDVLKRELGVRPLPETEELYRAILASGGG